MKTELYPLICRDIDGRWFDDAEYSPLVTEGLNARGQYKLTITYGIAEGNPYTLECLILDVTTNLYGQTVFWRRNA